MAANLDHERLFGWLYMLLGFYVEKHDLGLVLGSRSAVKITDFDGRLPDILFVRKERFNILEQRNLTGAPDLVIELVSPGDRRSEVIALEADYRHIGVPEIVAINVPRRVAGVRSRVVRVSRNVDGTYLSEEMESGFLPLQSVPGFRLDVGWVLDDSRPPVHEALAAVEAAG